MLPSVYTAAGVRVVHPQSFLRDKHVREADDPDHRPGLRSSRGAPD